MLIAALLELKSRLMLPGEEIEELDELAPAEAAEELLERMLAYARFRGAGGFLAARREAEQGVLYRSAPLPPALRRAPLEQAQQAYDPAVLGQALGGLLRTPPPIDLRHIAMPRVALPERLAVLRALLRRGTFSFDEAVEGADRMTVAVTALRAARALQARRGRLGPGRRLRPDHRPRRASLRPCGRWRDGARAPARGAAVPRARPRPGRGARRRAARRGGRGRRRAARARRRARGPRARPARAGGRLDARLASRRRGGRAAAARAPAHAGAHARRRPRRSRSSPTCSRSRARRSPASAASRPSRRRPRSPTAA